MPAANRREFLQQSSAGMAALSTIAYAGFAAAESREKMSVAVIGPGGMGMSHLKNLVKNPRVQVTHVCEVDAKRLAGAAQVVEEAYGKPPHVVSDMRQVFDDQHVKAVWIATPDHWHAPATILACAADKHVYVEKPCSHNLREGRLMIEAARKYKKVVQQGTQSRSTAHVIEAMKRLQEGAIGKILVSKAWNSQMRGNIGHSKPGTPPDDLKYDLWLGPAPETPYRKNMLPGRWRWWYDFGTGDMGNDGVHDLDIARWGLGVTTHPSTITASGAKLFFDDDQQFPDTQYVVFDYPGDGKFGDRRQLVYEQRIWSPYVQEGHENGNAYYGTEGMMIFGKKLGYQLYGRRNKLIEAVPATKDVDLVAHHNNFLDCIESGEKPNADIEIGYLSTSLCHLGNIASRVGRVVRFDPQTEQIQRDAEANALLHRKYRDGHWAVPAGASQAAPVS